MQLSTAQSITFKKKSAAQFFWQQTEQNLRLVL